MYVSVVCTGINTQVSVIKTHLCAKFEERWRIYHQERMVYAKLLRTKKKDHAHKEEQQLLKKAESKPYKVLEPRRNITVPHVPLETREAHFTELLQQTKLKKHVEPIECSKKETLSTLTEAEVWSVMLRSKPH